jgi:hypothetical protein
VKVENIQMCVLQLLDNGGGIKGREGVEQTKIKFPHNRDTFVNSFEHQLKY